jgi:hypothetical protein
MYCTIEDLRRLLPSSVSIGNDNLGQPSPGQTSVKRSSFTPEQATHYIRFASQEVDSRLRPFYSCPLRRTKTFETEILDNISAGTNVTVRVWDSNPFSQGDQVRVQNNNVMELATVASITDGYNVVLATLQNNYSHEDGKISVVEFPDPVPLLSAQLTVSYAFSQLFSAQQSPDISEYGKEQRRQAINLMDNILSGTILLFGQEHTGRRFVRGSLLDDFGSPTKDFQFGREKA